MEEIIIENNLKLISYFPNQEITLKWYQDLDVCKQVDNIDIPYTIERLDAMYNYLSSNGDCYYIEFNNTLVGDVSIFNDNEIAIVISKEFQNQHIGRKCINQMILLAKAKGIKELKATIFSFNTQSKKMFEAAGFKQVGKELYIQNLKI
ncbi:GNAT family N-acetyltransferase [Peptoniphilus sp. BV3AC2]|uniref:GNAT family N-acetyltransferase n=1 Tax=Peptoniphilus sp. BV3AC2 TaxID=1111133 RepID=UPI0003B8CFB8|nr:GNAT family N-acetyltransferase [Peptoniphilus sp. BV3AC2]ERT64931.1 acetyltransferase (GNAT) domain protein [Peptoniphilus sp. BV3AC2]